MSSRSDVAAADLADASLAALVGDQGARVEGQAGHSAAT